MNIVIYLLIAAVAIIGVAVLVVGRKLNRYKKSIPEEARLKNLQRQYPDLIDRLNKAVGVSDTEISLLNALQAINYPPETLRVSWVKKSGDIDSGISIVDYKAPPRRAVNSSLRNIHNGGGYGNNNDQHFFILQHKVKGYKDAYIELWFETDAPTMLVENLSAA